MKKRTLKIVSLMLAIVMAVSLLPLAALAEGEEQGEVAAVVYGPDFTKLVGDGQGNFSNLVDVIKSAAEKQFGDEDFIPEATITLTSLDDPNKVYTMHKTDEIKWTQSLQFNSEAVEKYKTTNAANTKKLKEKMDKAYDNYNKASLGKMTLWGIYQAAKIAYDASVFIDNALSDGTDNILDNINIAEAGRGYLFDTYTSGKIDAGTYKVRIEEFDGEGYVLTDYTDREQVIEVTGNDGKPIFVDEAKGRHWSGDFGIANLSFDFDLRFPGFWVQKLDIGFEFTNADVVDSGVNGSQFAMVNRDQTEKVLEFMKNVGESTFSTVMANLQNEEVFDYKEVIALHRSLIDTSNPSVPINLEVAQKLVTSYMALFTGMDKEFLSAFAEARADGMVLPTVLVTTSENVEGKDGVVRFSENSNQTLTWALSALDKIFENISEMNDQLKPIFDLYSSLKGVAEGAMNSVGYDLAHLAGIVGKKMPSGYYWMFQSEAAEDYVRSPLLYTIKVTWDNPTWLYVTVADLGLVGPYILEEFYDFVRDTTFEGPVAKSFKALSKGYEFGSDLTQYNVFVTENLRTTLKTGGIDLTDKNNQNLAGAFTAYIADTTYNALGLDKVFNTRVAYLNGINDYLVGNQDTAVNLMDYVNAQAEKAKSIYAGYVDENWVFYTLDKSPTSTATKLINKSTNEIAAAFPDGSERQAGIKQNGETVGKIVGTVGKKLEDNHKAVSEKVKTAVTKVLGKAFDTIKTNVKTVAKNLFSNFLGTLFGNKTANA